MENDDFVKLGKALVEQFTELIKENKELERTIQEFKKIDETEQLNDLVRSVKEKERELTLNQLKSTNNQKITQLSILETISMKALGRELEI